MVLAVLWTTRGGKGIPSARLSACVRVSACVRYCLPGRQKFEFVSVLDRPHITRDVHLGDIITVFKIFIWGGVSSDIRSEI